MNEKTLLEFPCDFPVKLMGRDTADFHKTARSLVEKHVGQLEDGDIQTASSRNGRFVSITVTVRAHSQQQLDDLYREISSHDDVLVAL